MKNKFLLGAAFVFFGATASMSAQTTASAKPASNPAHATAPAKPAQKPAAKSDKTASASTAVPAKPMGKKHRIHRKNNKKAAIKAAPK